MAKLRNGSNGGFEPGLSRLRVRHATTELPRSTKSHLSVSLAIVLLCLSDMHLSSIGLACFFCFPSVLPHPRRMAVQFEMFLSYFLRRLQYSCCSSKMLHFGYYPSFTPHIHLNILISFTSSHAFSIFCCRPGISTMQYSQSDCRFAYTII